MNRIQYEELFRFYVAKRLGVESVTIRSVEVPNPQRPALPAYKHQIDLYWETEDPYRGTVELLAPVLQGSCSR